MITPYLSVKKLDGIFEKLIPSGVKRKIEFKLQCLF